MKKKNYYKKIEEFVKTKKYRKSIIITTMIILVALIFISLLFIKEKDIKQVQPAINVSSFKEIYSLKDLRGRLGSYTEGFSGRGWNNREKTSVYHDTNSLNISLPIKYEFNEITIQDLNIKEEKDNSEFCIKKDCVYLENNKIYAKKKKQTKEQAKRVELPFYVSAIGKTDSFWLISVMQEKDEKNLEKKEKKVNAEIYMYDGEKYTKLVGKEFFNSDYKGQFLLGGTDNEFIAGYYGLDSKLLRFKQKETCDADRWFYKVIDNLNECYQAEDVSHWFRSRVGKILDIKFFNYKKHYVFYSTSQPFFGITDNNFLIDLTPELKLDNYQKVKLEYFNDKVLVKTDSKKGKKYFEFDFLGFDKSQTVSWVSSSLVDKTVKGASITSFTGKEQGGNFEFYFSNNDKDWIKVEPGKNVYFENFEDRKIGFYWRVDLIPSQGDPFASPFLSQVSMSYAK